MQRERKRRFGVNAIISLRETDDGVDAEMSLSLSLCISISLLRPYTFFLRSPLVFKTLFEHAKVAVKLFPVDYMLHPIAGRYPIAVTLPIAVTFSRMHMKMIVSELFSL